MCDDSLQKKYLQNILSLHQDFNSLVWSLSFYYSNALFYIRSSLFNIEKSFLPEIDSLDWVEGFEWKGIYIKVQTFESSKILFEEIKALNYVFFEYLQLVENTKTKNMNDKQSLSNFIVFPLISYCTFNGVVLYATCCVNKYLYDYDFWDKNSKNEMLSLMHNKWQSKENLIDDISCIDGNDANIKLIRENEDNDISTLNDNNNKMQIVNMDVNLNNYSLDDMSHSKILRNINKNNLLKIIDNLEGKEEEKFKYMIINARELIPDLTSYDNDKYRYFISDIPWLDRKYYSLSMREISTIEDVKRKFKDELNFDYNEEDIGKMENSLGNYQFKILYNKNEQMNEKYNNTIINKLIQLPLVQNQNIISHLLQEKESLQGNIIIDKFNNIFQKSSINYCSFIMYQIKKRLKQKYSLINNESKCDFITKPDFILHFEKFCYKLNLQANLIRSTFGLLNYIHKYGINTSFLIFILPKINSKYISDLIQISILCSVIKMFWSYHQGINYYLKLGLYNKCKNNTIWMTTSFNFNNSKKHKQKHMNVISIQKKKIISIIKTILFPNDNNQHNKSFNSFFIDQLNLFTLIKKLKWIIIDNIFNFKLFSKYDNKYTINNIIHRFFISCRENPFLFLSTIEYYLDVRFDFYTKFSSSISIQNIFNISIDKVYFPEPHVYSYINPKEISSYLLAKCVKVNNSFSTRIKKDSNISNNFPIAINKIPSFNGLIKSNLCNNNLIDYSISNLNSTFASNINIHNKTNSNNKTELLINNDLAEYRNSKIILESSRSLVNNKNFPISWDVILPKITIDFCVPPLVFKLDYSPFEEKNINKKINKYLSNTYYPLTKFEILNDWKNSIDSVFREIYSCDGQCEDQIFLCYIFHFVNYFYIEDNINKSKEIYDKIIDVFKYQNMRTVPSLAIQNLFKGLITESQLASEEFYSKCLIYTLFECGDMRGKFNKGHPFMMIPLYRLMNQTYAFDYIEASEFFKEMLLAMKYNINTLNKFKEKRNIYFYEDTLSYLNNFYLNNIHIKNEIRTEDEFDFLDEYNIQFGENKIKYSNYSTNDINKWDNYIFPSIYDIQISDKQKLRTKEYIYFFINAIISLYSSGNSIFINEDIINKQFNTKEKDGMDTKHINNNNNLLSHFLYCELMEKMSYKNQTPNGVVLSFGTNSFNETGQDNYSVIPIPKLLYKLTDFHISKIFCGYSHSIAIDINQKAFSWGNNALGQCGILREKIISIPTLILPQTQLKSASCSRDYSYFLSQNNTIYFCGLNLETKEIITPPIEFNISKEKKINDNIISIKSGVNHNILLTSKGKVYSWNYSILKGENISIGENAIVAIACGDNYSLALNSKGDVYSWGNAYSKAELPNKINTFNIPISDITCGASLNILITKDKEALSFKLNNKTHLGIHEQHISKSNDYNSKCNDIVIPILINEFNSMKVIKISCGENHCIAIVYDAKRNIKEVWSWGSNAYGQLGIGIGNQNQKENSPPSAINALYSYSNSEIFDVCCGRNFSILLLNRKDYKDIS